jgi:hypothetical protein
MTPRTFLLGLHDALWACFERIAAILHLARIPATVNHVAAFYLAFFTTATLTITFTATLAT